MAITHVSGIEADFSLQHILFKFSRLNPLQFHFRV